MGGVKKNPLSIFDRSQPVPELTAFDAARPSQEACRCAEARFETQVTEMKKTIVLSGLTALVVVAAYLGAARIPTQHIAANECTAPRYACFPPAVGFASLR